jgi:hypothetical protein
MPFFLFSFGEKARGNHDHQLCWDRHVIEMLFRSLPCGWHEFGCFKILFVVELDMWPCSISWRNSLAQLQAPG